jgi:hypothetical protein
MSEMKTLTTSGRIQAHRSSPACAGPRFDFSGLLYPSPDSSLAVVALARELDRLHERVVTPPLSALEACSARNWLRSARRLLCAGELGAARFQMIAVRRKLARRLPAEETR